MGQYQINDLERLTGIRAHTIRIWEKRYQLILPERTQTNIRLYNDDQVRKLLQVSVLLRAGQKISHIAALTEAELSGQVTLLSAATGGDSLNPSFIPEMIRAMLDYDEAAFNKIFTTAVQDLGFEETILQVVYPFLLQTGLLWSVNETLPVQEHFASGLIRRKLMAAIESLAVPSRPEKRFLLFLPEGEWHDIPLLFSEYLVRKAGYHVVNLGQHVPYEQLSKVIRGTCSTHLLFFLISGAWRPETALLLDQITLEFPDLHCIVSGNQYQLNQLDQLGPAEALTILREPSQLSAIL